MMSLNDFEKLSKEKTDESPNESKSATVTNSVFTREEVLWHFRLGSKLLCWQPVVVRKDYHCGRSEDAMMRY